MDGHELIDCRQWIGPDTIVHAGEVCISICPKIPTHRAGKLKDAVESHVGDMWGDMWELLIPGEAPLAHEPVGDRQLEPPNPPPKICFIQRLSSQKPSSNHHLSKVVVK